jgi:D-arabinose 1-dehydrogenase-like Zn-dependent alcohol dehydrogenase
MPLHSCAKVSGLAPQAARDVTPAQLILGNKAIQGWAAGTPADSADTLRFADLSGVRPMIETCPLERAAEAYVRMMSGNAQFRVVLTM